MLPVILHIVHLNWPKLNHNAPPSFIYNSWFTFKLMNEGKRLPNRQYFL